MVQNIDTVPLFISDQGVPYWLFIHKCQEKENIAELIQKFKRFWMDWNWKEDICFHLVKSTNMALEQ